MNKKIGVLLIIILGALAISAIVFYVTRVSNPSVDPVEINNFEENDGKNNTDSSQQSIKTDEADTQKNTFKQTVDPKKDLPLGQIDLERLAKSFSERFGSFSNQSNYSNITDLKMFMSEKMQKWADTYVAKNSKSSSDNAVYYGVTTKALSVKTQSYNESAGTAEIIVQTRRRESVGTSNNSSNLYSQDILISFVKEDSAWKVSSAYWQDK